MLVAWRIVKRRHADRAFDGDGARRHGGRWNSPGRAVVYVSESRALATLEVLAGLGSPELTQAFVLIGVELDEGLVAHLPATALPDGWRDHPPTPASQAVGDRWLDEGAWPVLRVPSALVPAEFDYLLNPAHADFRKIRVRGWEDLRFDPRWGR